MHIPFDHLIALNDNKKGTLYGFGILNELVIYNPSELSQVDTFISNNQGKFIFCCLNYNLKNTFLSVPCKTKDPLEFPLMHLWVPEAIVRKDGNNVNLIKGEISDKDYEKIKDFILFSNTTPESLSIQLLPKTSKQTYLKNVDLIKSHIQYGDIYEVNYCQEFFQTNTSIKNPWKLYQKISAITNSPFSAFIANNNHNVYCFSPERFLKRSGENLSSEPIKGTAPRGNSPSEDEEFKYKLLNDPKERSENIMIVDLVRNDLSKIAQKGTVKVDALCEIKSYPTVHQMVSTISCKTKTDSFLQTIKATFPMGSMTGVPKKRALELMEQYEDFNRSLYSGSIGYIDPNGDFDLNVVIRTLIQNKHTGYLSCGVGSAITIKSDADREYNECILKIEKILKALNESE